MKGAVRVVKIPGEEDPADLMTKYLHVVTISSHLHKMNFVAMKGNAVKMKGVKERTRREGEGERALVTGRWADEEEENGDIEKVGRWWDDICM